MARNDWSELDLRTRSTMGPFDDEWIILHLIPKSPAINKGDFVVGKMTTEEGRSWFIPFGGGCWSISALRNRYKVEWAHLPPTN